MSATRLYHCVSRFGEPVSDPCIHCRHLFSRCVVDMSSGHCAKCILHKKKCSHVESIAKLDQIAAKLASLEAEVDQLEAEALAKLAKASCLRKTCRQLKLDVSKETASESSLVPFAEEESPSLSPFFGASLETPSALQSFLDSLGQPVSDGDIPVESSLPGLNSQ
jgi:outer membrane murein-binding lipoprotein Lpp